MTTGRSPRNADACPDDGVLSCAEPETRQPLIQDDAEATRLQLREALARERALLREKDELVRRLFAWPLGACDHVEGLTPRQRQIMSMVLAGHASKNIAADLGISQRTVEAHRASIMKKTGSKSLPALIRLSLTGACASARTYPAAQSSSSGSILGSLPAPCRD